MDPADPFRPGLALRVKMLNGSRGRPAKGAALDAGGASGGQAASAEAAAPGGPSTWTGCCCAKAKHACACVHVR